jgi:hypothetical protein
MPHIAITNGAVCVAWQWCDENNNSSNNNNNIIARNLAITLNHSSLLSVAADYIPRKYDSLWHSNVWVDNQASTVFPTHFIGMSWSNPQLHLIIIIII